MTEKRAFMEVESEPPDSGALVEQTRHDAVDALSTAGVALQALDTARYALQLAAAANEAARYAAASMARSTLKVYAAYWDQWQTWCQDNGLSALPADGGSVALYIAWRARTHAPATIQAELAAIAAAHRAAAAPDPTKDLEVKTVLRGIRKTKGVAQAKKAPLVAQAMREVLDTLDDSARGRRDRCMLLVGWTGALRRSEIVAINHEDLALVKEGLILTIRRSKTDRYGQGDTVGLPKHPDPRYDVVRAYCGWVERSGAHEGPVFRPVTRHGYVLPRRINDRSVALLVKRVARLAGLQGDYSGHSLRAGLATSAAAAGAGEASIMRQTRHKSVTVMRGYIRPASVWIENAAAVAAL
jgi:integrase